MGIILFLILWFFISRAVIVRFRNWVEDDEYVIDLPLPLWVYALLLAVAAVPAALIAAVAT